MVQEYSSTTNNQLLCKVQDIYTFMLFYLIFTLCKEFHYIFKLPKLYIFRMLWCTLRHTLIKNNYILIIVNKDSICFEIQPCGKNKNICLKYMIRFINKIVLLSYTL